LSTEAAQSALEAAGRLPPAPRHASPCSQPLARLRLASFSVRSMRRACC
jgi:hypothetical protein